MDSIKEAITDNSNKHISSDNGDSDSNDDDLELGFFAQQIPSIVILFVESITDIVFKQLNKFTRHKSDSELDINCFYYSIYSSFVLYMFVQGILLFFGVEALENLV